MQPGLAVKETEADSTPAGRSWFGIRGSGSETPVNIGRSSGCKFPRLAVNWQTLAKSGTYVATPVTSPAPEDHPPATPAFAGRARPLSERITGNERLLDLPAVLDQLVHDGYISQRQAEDVLIAPRTKKELAQHPLEVVAAREFENRNDPGKPLDLETLTDWLCRMSGQPYLRIDPLKINVNAVTEVMSYAFAQRHNILAVEVADDEVVIASGQPFMYQWETMLTQTLRGRRIRRVVANPADLNRYMLEFYTMARAVSKAGEAGLEVSNITNFEARRQRSPRRQHRRLAAAVRLRPARQRHPHRAAPRRATCASASTACCTWSTSCPRGHAAVTSRIKILGRMDVAEKRRPQDGRIKTKSPDGDEVELRLSTMPTAFGEKLVMRIFDPDVLVRSFRELGLSGDDLRALAGMVNQPHGIVLVTGPTGSGKTTTLYSTLKQLATPRGERLHHRGPDRDGGAELQPDAGAAPASAWTSPAACAPLLRQDPDIIMIGEIRDLETAEMAVQAALTGHLVLSTLHTNDAPRPSRACWSSACRPI
jgi:general secretion pathway protein E